MGKRNPRELARQRRKMTMRKKIRGTPERPRLCVYCSLRHVYAQIIDDENGMTLGAASSLSASTREEDKSSANIAGAKKVGRSIAEIAIARDIRTVVFDRNGYIYHGKVKALADAARETGLRF